MPDPPAPFVIQEEFEAQMEVETEAEPSETEEE